MGRQARRTARRLVLAAIAVSLCVTAALAIGILLFGDFGETEGRILGTTMLLAAYGLVALPAGFLVDQSRHTPLALTLLGLSATGLTLAVASIWSDAPSDALGKTVLTVTVCAVALSQTAALAARSREGDPQSVKALFAASCALALALATMASVAAWAEIDDSTYFRILGALAVLDVLFVLLQPVLALSRPRGTTYRLRVAVEPPEELETEIEAADFAAAAARAIRETERSGRQVLGVTRV